MAEPVLTENEKLVLMDLNNVESDEEYTDWVEYAKEEKVDVNKLANIALKKFAMDKEYDIVIILINNGADVNIIINGEREISLLDWCVMNLQQETLELGRDETGGLKKDERGNLEPLMCKANKNDSNIEKILKIIILILDKDVKLTSNNEFILNDIINKKCDYYTNPNIYSLLLSLKTKLNPKKKEGGKRKSRKQRKSRNQKKQLRSRRFRRHAR